MRRIVWAVHKVKSRQSHLYVSLTCMQSIFIYRFCACLLGFFCLCICTVYTTLSRFFEFLSVSYDFLRYNENAWNKTKLGNSTNRFAKIIVGSFVKNVRVKISLIDWFTKTNLREMHFFCLHKILLILRISHALLCSSRVLTAHFKCRDLITFRCLNE